ncbi:MAG: ABC transporter permease [Planctomycetes bacterium]|nr:ABC transporter permease [Planctomycetota bacterium]
MRYELWPFITVALAATVFFGSRLLKERAQQIVLPLATFAVFVSFWQFGCDLKKYELRDPATGTVKLLEVFPTPGQTALELGRMLQDGTLLRYTVASLYRVAIGFGLAVLIGTPLGLWMGWSTRAFRAVNPLAQGLRPISPIAWIPVAILWFGVEDASAIFLIFIATIFPIVTGAYTAVHSIPSVYVRSARNFGLERTELFRYVVFPASLPQIIGSLRLALGIAWMVIVAAEMIAVQSGLGYVITDARNGNNYARVCGAMVCLGVLGILLDLGMRQLQKLDEVRWGFSNVA